MKSASVLTLAVLVMALLKFGPERWTEIGREDL